MQPMLRLPATRTATGRGRTSTYEDIKNGLFVPPVRIGARAVAWPENEVAAINAARIAGKSPDDIRALVAKLVAARGGAGGPK